MDEPVRHWRAEAADSGRRIDNYLIGRLRGVPRSRIYRMLRSGELRVNGRRVKQHYRLQEGDRLRIPPLAVPSRRPGAAPPELSQRLRAAILLEDSRCLAIDKPGGISVHGGTGIACGLIEALRQLRGPDRYLELIHRLDRDTSGCLLLAKTPAFLAAAHQALRNRRVHKEYLALVRGSWRHGARKVELALRREAARGGREQRMSVHAGGRAAVSYFKPVQTFADASLLSVSLETGRTHQIRAHAASIGYPIAGDRRYGDPAFNADCRSLGLRRMFLHASRLAFLDRDLPYDVSAPLPPELSDVLTALEPR